MGVTTYLFIGVVAVVLILMAFNKITAVRNKKQTGELLAQRGMKAPEEFIISEVYRLLVDRSARRWCVYKMGDKDPQILKYEQLVDFEICDHGVVLAAGDGSGPLMKAGFAEAARGGKKLGNICSQLYLSVELDDGQVHSVSFIGQAIVRTSQKYATTLNYAKQVAEQLCYILVQNQKSH